MYAPKGEDGVADSEVGFSCSGWPFTSYTPPTVISGPENVPPRGQTAILPFFLTIQMEWLESISNIAAMVVIYRMKFF